uniref:non-specific serine/threonine protein kinase n=1 Tax=Trichobilharzia regenti TaxID=157069 RepID=A0AA85IP72_TRIRE|nr:unnamed protein product [Trichobilharzia regenti]
MNESYSKDDHGRKKAAKIVYQISSAISHLHERNIAHRDLKPENLLYTSNEPNAILKLTDFGFAKEVVAKKSLQTPCYTPYYLLRYLILRNMINPVISGPWSERSPYFPGMKSKIRAGKYDFPDAQWKHVSKSAKDLIRSLLLTEPDCRPTIKEVMNHHWVAQYNAVPNTPLGTNMLFTTKAWDQFREIFRESLQTKRKEHSSVPTLMTLDASKNPLLIKRKLNQQSNPDQDEDVS